MVSNYILWDFCVGEREIEPSCFLCFYLWLFFLFILSYFGCFILFPDFVFLVREKKSIEFGKWRWGRVSQKLGDRKLWSKYIVWKIYFQLKKQQRFLWQVVTNYDTNYNTGLPRGHISYLWSHLCQHVAQKHTSKTDFKSSVFFIPSILHMTLAPHSLQYLDLLLD